MFLNALAGAIDAAHPKQFDGLSRQLWQPMLPVISPTRTRRASPKGCMGDAASQAWRVARYSGLKAVRDSSQGAKRTTGLPKGT